MNRERILTSAALGRAVVDEGADRVVTADVDLLAALAEAAHGRGRGDGGEVDGGEVDGGSDGSDGRRGAADDDPGVVVDVLCPAEALDRVDERFAVASRLAALRGTGAVEVRALDADDRDGPTTLVESTDAIRLAVPLGGGDLAVAPLDEAVREAVATRTGERWAAATPWTPDAPPHDAVVESADEALGEAVRAAFVEGLSSTRTRSRGRGAVRLGPVELMVLVAASRERELRAVVEWATDAGVASQGTVSRAKTRLEEAGVVTTSPVRAGVGRPRQRLGLAEGVGGGSTAELLAAVETVL